MLIPKKFLSILSDKGFRDIYVYIGNTGFWSHFLIDHNENYYFSENLTIRFHLSRIGLEIKVVSGEIGEPQNFSGF